ncbi:MAG: hypothetical protein KDC07_05655, partial [Chitinophagaceae bacterium]|nr:hypothetical protein [Chitinophagaceae bacterium]
MDHLFPQTPELIYAIGWALMHALWQGLLIYALLRLALRFIPGNYSSLRYYTALSALGVLIGWFGSTLLYQYNNMMLQQDAGNAVATTMFIYDPGTGIETAPVWNKLLVWYSMHTGAIVGLYITGMLLLACRLLYNLFLVNKLRTTGLSDVPDQWMGILSKCCQTLQINKNIRLHLSEIVSVPMVMGALKPVVLMPIALAGNLSLQETETILLHELAHIKRNDYLL